MKIYTTQSMPQFESSSYRTKTETIKKTSEPGFSQDRITIGAGSENMQEKAIISRCTGKLINEVRMSRSEEKLEAIKQQVVDGTYRPDAEKIAAKIMMIG